MGTPPQLTTTWSTGLSQASSGMLCAPFGHTRCGGKGLTAGSSGGVVLLTLVDAHTRPGKHLDILGMLFGLVLFAGILFVGPSHAGGVGF